MQHLYQHHPAHMHFSSDDVIGSSNQDVEIAMNQIQMLNQYEKDNSVAPRSKDCTYSHNFFSYNSTNVPDIVPSVPEDHIKVPENAEAIVDLTDIPEFNVRYTNIPGEEIRQFTYNDDNSNGK